MGMAFRRGDIRLLDENVIPQSGLPAITCSVTIEPDLLVSAGS